MPAHLIHQPSNTRMATKHTDRRNRSYAHAQHLRGDERLSDSKLARLMGEPTINDIQFEARCTARPQSAGAVEALAVMAAARPTLSPRELEKQLLHCEQKQAEHYKQRAAEYHADKLKDQRMTVSIYQSTASGARETVVQTNAQNLDVFITGLAETMLTAIDDADAHAMEAIVVSVLKNAFPIAFAISGYKAEKVSESKLLTCGFASLDASVLVATSKV